MIIDSHAHIYSPDEVRYPTRLGPLRPPAGAGTLDHLQREMRDNGVRAVCVIQTSSFYGFDNRFILDTSCQNFNWIAGVCTPDPDNSRSPDLLRSYVEESGVRGMRSVVGSTGSLLDDGVRALWRAADALGIVLNVLIDPPLAEEADMLIGEHPNLRVVLDHCLNLKAGPQTAEVLAKLRRLSRRSNVYAKLSFLITGSEEQHPFRDMHDLCREVIGMFGPDRCTWGSAFPCELWAPKASYRENLTLFLNEIKLDEEERRQVLEGTAQRLWFPNLTE